MINLNFTNDTNRNILQRLGFKVIYCWNWQHNKHYEVCYVETKLGFLLKLLDYNSKVWVGPAEDIYV